MRADFRWTNGCIFTALTTKLLSNSDRAIKHWTIAAASGNKDSLDKIKLMFTKGTVTKAQYERALRTYQNYLEGIQSDQRTLALDFVRAYNQTDSAG